MLGTKNLLEAQTKAGISCQPVQTVNRTLIFDREGGNWPLALPRLSLWGQELSAHHSSAQTPDTGCLQEQLSADLWSVQIS